MVNMHITVNEYTHPKGSSPYSDWLAGLRDKRARAKVIMQVDRMELGMFGDSQPIGEGVSELRIHYGPGYRMYYAKEGKTVYLLLCGGDKSTQSKDIKRAREYWLEHKQRHKDGA